MDVPVGHGLHLWVPSQDRQERPGVLQAEPVQPADVDGQRLVMEKDPGRATAGWAASSASSQASWSDESTPFLLPGQRRIQQDEPHPRLLERLTDRVRRGGDSRLEDLPEGRARIVVSHPEMDRSRRAVRAEA